MNIKELKELIKEKCVVVDDRVNSNIGKDAWWTNRKLEYLKATILEATKFAEDCVLPHRVSMIMLDITERTTCKLCNSLTRWRYDKRAFGDYCSVRCSSKATVEVRKATNLERYGVDNYSKSKEFLEKSKATFMQNYGVDNPSKSPVILAKIQEAFNSYEGGHPLRDPAIKAKAVQTSITKYGCHHTQRHVAPEKLKLMDDYNWLKTFLKANTVQQLADYIGMSHSNTNVKLKALNLYTEVASGFQNSVYDFLKTFIPETDIQVNCRNLIHPLEIDIYIPSKNIAIECNGTYWHTELNGRGRDYHLNKTELLKAKGIHLIHVWEHQWNTQNEIVKSRLSAKLGKSVNVYARKCTIFDISTNVMDKFLEANHVQGSCTASVRLGLVYDGELKALMTFGKSRYDKSVEWELLRYCTESGISVTGGASKLLSHFCKLYSPKSLVSYSAKEWNTGNLYSTLGFKWDSTSAPSYYYTNDYVTFFNRVSFQKHKLSEKLEVFDPEKTEWENMQINGFDRIWDCGTDKWIIKF